MVDWRDKTLFKKPKWLKPELDKVWYYPHIVILGIVVVILMRTIFGYEAIPTELNVIVLFHLGVAAIIGDGIAHTVMGRD